MDVASPAGGEVPATGVVVAMPNARPSTPPDGATNNNNVDADADAKTKGGDADRQRAGGSDRNDRLALLRRICNATDREWRKGVKRKLCDASVVTDQIADHALALLREHGAKPRPSSSTSAASVLDRGELDRLAAAPAVRAHARKRVATVVNKVTVSVLEKVMAHKWAWLFNEEVDADGMGLVDYHAIVKHPMALATVKAKAQAGGYATASEAASDVRLVFRNAQLYNKPGTDVNIMACALLDKFEGLWRQKLVQKLQEEEGVAKGEESLCVKKKADALRAQENGVFRQKCQSYERLLSEVEKFVVDVQQQAMVSARPCARPEREEATRLMTALHDREDFEAAKPALSLLLQRYPEMLNGNTREIEVDLMGVDPLTLRQVLVHLRAASGAGGGEGNGDGGRPADGKGQLRAEIDAWVDATSAVERLRRRNTS